MKKNKSFMLIGGIIVVVAVVVIGFVLLKPAEKQEEVKIDGFDFVVSDKDGKDIHFANIVKDKPVVVYFWVDWVPLSTEMLPLLQNAYDKWGDQVDFMIIYAPTEGSPIDAGVKLIKEDNYTFPAFYDANQEAITKLKVYALPAILSIDSEGNDLKRGNGRYDEDQINKFIEQVLSDNK